MKKKVKNCVKLSIPLLILIILNFYVFNGRKAAITTLGIVAIYIFILLIINTKNKYFSIESFHKKRYVIAIVLFVVLVLFKFHGSSIEYWDNYYHDYGDSYTKTTLLGSPRSIRSDEWLVQSPMYLAQAKLEDGLQRKNTNINPDGQDMILAFCTPVFDATILGNPFNWGFLFLDVERAFSWYWNFKAIALFMLSYEMALMLSKKNTKIALFGATLIAYSSATQWWFSTAVVNLIIYSQACIVATYYYFEVKGNSKKKIFLVGMFTVGGIGYILNLYPAIQVPLGYLSVILFLYLVIKNKDKINKKDIVTFSISVATIVGIIIYFVFTAKDAINAVSNTVYPGARFEVGGKYSLNLISNYIFDWLLPYRDITFFNSSEASGFVSLIPLIIILFFVKKKDEEDKILINIMFIYMIVMLSFLIIGYPPIIAKVTLFSYSTTNRMMLVIGLACNYLLFMLIARMKECASKYSIAVGVTILTIIIIFVPHYHTESQYYLKRSGVIIAMLIFSMLVYLIIRRDIVRLVPYGVIMMLITGFTVNPIARTLAPILQKEVSKAIISINEREPGKWAAVGNSVGGNFLYANGVETYNGVKYYPNLEMWHILDEKQEYKNIYNRYEHITLNLTKGDTTFTLIAPDAIEVKIDVNSLNKTGIKYLMSSENLECFNTGEHQYFEELYYNGVDKTYIYRYNK